MKSFYITPKDQNYVGKKLRPTFFSGNCYILVKFVGTEFIGGDYYSVLGHGDAETYPICDPGWSISIRENEFEFYEDYISRYKKQCECRGFWCGQCKDKLFKETCYLKDIENADYLNLMFQNIKRYLENTAPMEVQKKFIYPYTFLNGSGYDSKTIALQIIKNIEAFHEVIKNLL